MKEFSSRIFVPWIKFVSKQNSPEYPIYTGRRSPIFILMGSRRSCEIKHWKTLDAQPGVVAHLPCGTAGRRARMRNESSLVSPSWHLMQTPGSNPLLSSIDILSHYSLDGFSTFDFEKNLIRFMLDKLFHSVFWSRVIVRPWYAAFFTSSAFSVSNSPILLRTCLLGRSGALWRQISHI